MAKTTTELTVVCDNLSARLEAFREELNNLRAENKALTEQLHAEQIESARAREEAANARRDLDRANARIDSLVSELAIARQDTAVVRQQHLDHVKQVEVWDGRRWAMFVVLIGAVMSLASGLVVALAKK